MNELADRQIRTDIEMQVVARDREIHLLFSEKHQDGTMVAAFTSNFLMSPTDALRFAGLTADLAFEVDTGLKAAGSGLKAALVERARVKMTQRVALMLKTMREDKVISNHKIAQEVVDAVLREVYS